jgi:hypothetical protein
MVIDMFNTVTYYLVVLGIELVFSVVLICIKSNLGLLFTLPIFTPL